MMTTRFNFSNLLWALAWMPGFATAIFGTAETNLGEYENLCLTTESLPYMGIEEDFELLTIQHMGEPRSVFASRYQWSWTFTGWGVARPFRWQ